MANATVATNFYKPFNIESYVATKISFYVKVVVYILTKLCNVIFGQILDSCVGIDSGGGENISRGLKTDTKDICQSDLHPFFTGQVYT